MEKKQRASETGIRMEIITGTDEAVGVDKLVDDFLHNKVDDALGDLHEPHREAETAAE